MPSTNKTKHLNLNKWEAEDRPKRNDFVSDNTILDTVVGEHINNSSLHVTASEKQKLAQMYTCVAYAGTGAATETIVLDFVPSIVFVYKKFSPPVSYNSGGYMVVNSAACGTAALGGSPGVAISGKNVVVSQSTSASNGMFLNLNQEYGQYVVIALR